MKRYLLIAFVAFSVRLCPGMDIESVVHNLRNRFEPILPTVSITYDVAYRLLGLRLMQVAEAQIDTTEGYWHKEDGTRVRACFMEMALQSPECHEADARDARIYMNSRLLSVVTMPELDTLYYIKITDESLRPIFGRNRCVHNMHIYNLENEHMDFYAENYLTGEVSTNLEGAMDMAAQGRAVIDVLNTMSDVYNGRRPMLTPNDDFRIFVNCDGIAVPFAAKTRRDEISLLDRHWTVLRCDVMPAGEAPPVKSRPFAMWATSFSDFAQGIDNPTLVDIAARTPDWGMTPLMADYALCLGSIRCSIRHVDTIHHTGRTLARAQPETMATTPQEPADL